MRRHRTEIFLLHDVLCKEKKLLGFSSSTAQMRTPRTLTVRPRCIGYRRSDVKELLGFFSSKVHIFIPGMTRVKLYSWKRETT